MTQGLLSLDAVAHKIADGARLLVAGDETLLRRLPKGRWIAGTIPYFMDVAGGTFDEQKLFVTELPEYCAVAKVEVYDRSRLNRVFADGPANGFSFIIIPGMSKAHLAFAVDAPGYSDFAQRPLIGWIAGVNLDQLGKITPKVIDGTTLAIHEDAAVVMHVALPADKAADVQILNIFEPSAGDAIRFPETGFTARKATVNGKEVSFADYVEAEGLDTRMPLVADYAGARVNTSFQKVERDRQQVSFYAPVFAGMDYHLAKRVDDYVQEFTARIPKVHEGDIVFSCNCILNYLHSELQGKKTAGFVGPITFGEIAYQLVNQTLAYLVVMDSQQ
jgi:hypothetical protein